MPACNYNTQNIYTHYISNVPVYIVINFSMLVTGGMYIYILAVATIIYEMVRLMDEIVEGWQKMEGKDKVVCIWVIDKACENERVQKEVERLHI